MTTDEKYLTWALLALILGQVGVLKVMWLALAAILFCLSIWENIR